MEHSTFVLLLERLQSVENDVRVNAENSLGLLAPPVRLGCLMESMADSNLGIETRCLAAVLCRRLLLNSYKEAFLPLPEEVQSAVKQQLLMGIVHESFGVLKRKIADVAAELARAQYIEPGGHTDGVEASCQWREFSPFIFDCFKSPSPDLREIACHMFVAVIKIFGRDEVSCLTEITQMINAALTEPSAAVRTSGLKALSAFVCHHSTNTAILHSLKQVTHAALMTIASGIETDPGNDSMLKCLVEIADICPKFLRPYLSLTLELCYKILSNTNLSDEVRHLALESIITLAENMPAAVRKTSNSLIEPLVRTLLCMMTEVEEEPGWEKDDSLYEEDDETNSVTAEKALDRFSCALASPQVIAEIIRTVPVMLQDPDWRKRYAGLMAVSACGDGCHKQMEAMLGSVLEAVVPLMADPHPRVVYAACNAIGQLSSDFGPRLQKNHHALVVPALMHVLDSQHPRVQANAGASLVNFCENSPKSVLSQYLDVLVKRLEGLMKTTFQEMIEKGRKLVLFQTVTSIAAVADSAGSDFAPYYENFMPGLKYIMEHAVHPDLRLLRGKTIECISLIGLAVGKEKFLQDAGPIMDLLLKTQTAHSEDAAGDSDGQLASDDPQTTYIISAWARICKLLGRSFEPYLPMVMPQVLKSAKVNPDVCLLDNEEAEGFDGDLDWQILKLSENQNYAVYTGFIEDKATACQMLVCYARELKEGFALYCEEVLNTMLPMLVMYFSDEVRAAASEIMPYLMESLKTSRPDILASAWDRVFAKLLEAVTSEPERDLIADLLDSIAGSVDRLGAGCLNTAKLQELHRMLDRLFHEHFEKDEERHAKRQDEDYDELEEERLLSEKNEDEYVLSKICDIMRVLLVTHKAEALSMFHQLMVHIVKLSEPNRPWSDLQWCLCFWDDLVEHAGLESWALRDFFLPTLAASIEHPQPDVRQAGLYGIGAAAMFGGPEYEAVLGQFISPLVRLIEAAGSRSEDNNVCTENAISAITKIMKYRGHCVLQASVGGLNGLIERWLGWLPVSEDGAEVEHVYGFLCDLVEANSQAALGADNANIVTVALAISGALAEGAFTSRPEDDSTPRNSAKLVDGRLRVYQRCIAILQQLRENQSVFETCLIQMSDKQKQAIHAALMVQ